MGPMLVLVVLGNLRVVVVVVVYRLMKVRPCNRGFMAAAVSRKVNEPHMQRRYNPNLML